MSIIELIFGPQHPALHEPEMFRFHVDGEKVIEAIPRIGYVHRGIEKLFEQKTHVQNIYLSERICGICNVAHTLTYVNVIERAGNIDVPPRAKYLRVIVAELNRLHSHMLLLGAVAELMGFTTLFMLIWRDREKIMDLVELITGNRVISAYNTIGGVRRDIDSDKADKIRKVLLKVEEEWKEYKKTWMEDPTITRRTMGVGILKPRDALKYCVVGPVLRGSGVKSDVRKDDPYEVYGDIPFNVVTYDTCDSWARYMVRVDEILESINIILYALDNLPQGEIRRPLVRRLPEAEAFAKTEAPRGELVYHLYSKGGFKPYRLKVRTPTFANILGATIMFKGERIADIPVILGSIDPCFACEDRHTIVDLRSGKSFMLSSREITRKFSRGSKP